MDHHHHNIIIINRSALSFGTFLCRFSNFTFLIVTVIIILSSSSSHPNPFAFLHKCDCLKWVHGSCRIFAVEIRDNEKEKERKKEMKTIDHLKVIALRKSLSHSPLASRVPGPTTIITFDKFIFIYLSNR